MSSNRNDIADYGNENTRVSLQRLDCNRDIFIPAKDKPAFVANTRGECTLKRESRH